MDPNKPARFLDTAYNALKGNPGATNQIVQAAAHGAPVGLRGLAAAAAQQSQQDDARAKAAMMAQGPQPNVMQKLAMQNLPGIMGQLPANIQLAAAPTGPAPEQMPTQMMATGGLVSFADGGNVLPPDVIDAIQSHFAEGGDVRGYAGGEDVDISEALRRTFGFGPKPEATAEEMARLERVIAGQRIPMGMEESLKVPFQGPSEASAAAEAEALRNKIAGQRMTQGMSESVAPKPFGLTGPYPSAVQDEMARLDELLRKQRASEYMLEGMQKGARYSPEALVVEEKVPSSMTAKLTEAARPKMVGISPADAAAEMERLTPKQGKWTSGAADEAFNFGRLSELAGKLPEGVKATGRLLGKVAPYSAAFDPRVMALVKANVGGARMAGEELAKLTGGTSEDGTLRKWLLEHGAPDLTPSPGAEDVLGGLASLRENFAYGGEVRGYAGGDLIKSLTGQSESPGMGLLKRAADFFTPDVNEAISREDFDASRAASAQKEKDMATLDQLLENYPRESAPKKSVLKTVTTPTWQADPDPHTGTPAVPKVPVHEAGTKLDKTFDQAKVDTGTKTTDKDIATSGLNALAPGMDMEKMRDLIMGLGGHKELSPELSQQLGELKDSARTSTILQSILGGLGGGLTNPYGGRFALGSAALGALGGYQKGSAGEEEIGRKAFDILRGYADAPEEEKTKARDLLLGQLSKSAELESEERRSALRAGSGLSLEDRIELAKVKAGLGPSPYQQTQITAAQQLARDRASDNAMKEIEEVNKGRRANVQPELTEAEKKAIIERHFAMQGVPYIGGLGAQQSAGQSGGLGGGPLVLK